MLRSAVSNRYAKAGRHRRMIDEGARDRDILVAHDDAGLFDGEAKTWLKILMTLGITFAEGVVPFVWNVFADPTTATDPLPTAGPELGDV